MIDSGQVFAEMERPVALLSLHEVSEFITKVPVLMGKGSPVSFTTRPPAELFGYLLQTTVTVDNYDEHERSIGCLQTLHALWMHACFLKI